MCFDLGDNHDKKDNIIMHFVYIYAGLIFTDVA